jgi:hypothetical protein
MSRSQLIKLWKLNEEQEKLCYVAAQNNNTFKSNIKLKKKLMVGEKNEK